jgi:hypothetical protein
LHWMDRTSDKCYNFSTNRFPASLLFVLLTNMTFLSRRSVSIELPRDNERLAQTMKQLQNVELSKLIGVLFLKVGSFLFSNWIECELCCVVFDIKWHRRTYLQRCAFMPTNLCRASPCVFRWFAFCLSNWQEAPSFESDHS